MGASMRAAAVVVVVGLLVAAEASAAPVVSPELEVDLPVVGVTPVQGGQYWPAMAWNGTSYFVVWMDKRRGTWPTDVFGARVSPDGEVLDPTGIAVGLGGQLAYPAVAWTGSSWLVVWHRNSGTGTPYDVYGVRVSAAGAVLDPAPVRLSPTSGSQSVAKVACGGGQCLVVWMDGDDLRGTRVTPALGVLDPSPFEICVAAGMQYAGALEWDGAQFVVAWTDTRAGGYDVYAARVTPGGGVLDPGGIPVAAGAGDALDPALAFDGASFLVAWRTGLGTPADVAAARLGPAGVVLDATPITVTTAPFGQANVAAKFDGTSFVVAWQDWRDGSTWDLYAARIAPDGAVLDPDGLPVAVGPADQAGPALGFDGTRAIVVWSDDVAGSWGAESDLYATRLDGAGGALDVPPVRLTSAANRQDAPAAAWSGAAWLVVWEDFRAGAETRDVYGARVGPAGAMLDPDAIPIATAAGAQASPVVAWDGLEWVVAWEDGRDGLLDVHVTRVAADGAVLDPEGVPLTTTWSAEPAVAADGMGGALVAMRRGGDWASADIHVARVAGGVALDDPTIAVAAVPYEQEEPRVVWRGGDYLVAWRDNRLEPSSGWDLFGARVTADGVVADPGGVYLVEGGYQASLAWSGATTLVVWSYWYDLGGARIGDDLTVLDATPFMVSEAPFTEGAPAVTWDGVGFLAVWEDDRVSAPPDQHLYGARIDAAATVLDPTGFAVSTLAESESTPAIASDGAGRSLVAYQRWIKADGFWTVRLRARILLEEALPLGAACGAVWECASGTCAGGVCCEPPCEAAEPDAGPPDAGSPDASPLDASPPDASPPAVDAGAPDAGSMPPDAAAGASDGGSASDAMGSADGAIATPDAGTLASQDSGCGCSAAGARRRGAAPLLILAAALAAVRRRGRIRP